MSQSYTVVYINSNDGNQRVRVINGKDICTTADALAAFETANPTARVMAVIDQAMVASLTNLQQQLAEKLEQAAAALPDAWFATKHGVPVELIESIKVLVDESKAQGLINVQGTITITHGEHGEFEICSDTGKVLTPASEMEEPYDRYDRADIQEYLQWAHVAGLPRPTSINALGLRWIHKSGYVEEAEMDWRDDLLDARGLGWRLAEPMDRIEWEGDVFHQICVQGDIPNGDAQSLTEAKQDLFDDLFVKLFKPAAAAKRLLERVP